MNSCFQMEQIKRANKLFSNDCIFLRNSLNIPVVSEKRYIFNGLSLESPDGEGEAVGQEAESTCVVAQDIEGPTPPSSPNPADSRAPRPQPEELSAKDFLHRLDLQIKQSKQAARRIKEEEVRWDVGRPRRASCFCFVGAGGSAAPSKLMGFSFWEVPRLEELNVYLLEIDVFEVIN